MTIRIFYPFIILCCELDWLTWWTNQTSSISQSADLRSQTKRPSSFSLVQCRSETEWKQWSGHICLVGLTNKMCLHSLFAEVSLHRQERREWTRMNCSLKKIVQKHLFVCCIISFCTLDVLCKLINKKITLRCPKLFMWREKWGMIWGALVS